MAADPGKVVAFYSFKGGTGRSMALANVACLLAAKPGSTGRVLVIDWDLEAPGLHRYFGKQLFKAFRGIEEEQRRFPGLIDLFVELRGRLADFGPQAPQEYAAAAAMLGELPIAEYVIETDRPQLHLLKAGCFDDAYPEKVSNFDWQDIYVRSPHLLRALSDRLATDYAWVLIDSRTGFTDTSGICTMLMPETLVVVFTPNQQSLDGVVDLVRDAGKYRARSDDLRPLVVYPLPSRIEASEPALRKLWRSGDPKVGIDGYQAAFEQVFKDIYKLPQCSLGNYFDDVQIQHVPKFAYGEAIAVLGEESNDRFSLTRSFQRFAERMGEDRLPWEAAPSTATDEQLQPEEPDPVHDRMADAVMRQAAERIAKWRHAGRRYQLADTVVNFGTIISLTATVAAMPSGPRWLMGTVVGVVAVAQALRIFFQPQRRSDEYLRASRELEAARIAFEVDGSSPEGTARLRKQLDAHLFDAFPALSVPALFEPRRRTGVYISYRRDDAAIHAQLLYDTLVATFGTGKVLMDVDSIAPGQDFRRALDESVAEAGTMLAVIGPRWLDARDSAGRRRLDNAADFIRVELAAALARQVRVIPILVAGAVMPHESELPQELQPLARRQAFEISERRLQYDLARLLEAIDPSLAKVGA